jgi:hypothetical protein
VAVDLAAACENANLAPVQVQKLFFLLDREAASLIGGPHFSFSLTIMARSTARSTMDLRTLPGEIWRASKIQVATAFRAAEHRSAGPGQLAARATPGNQPPSRVPSPPPSDAKRTAEVLTVAAIAALIVAESRRLITPAAGRALSRTTP